MFNQSDDKTENFNFLEETTNLKVKQQVLLLFLINIIIIIKL